MRRRTRAPVGALDELAGLEVLVALEEVLDGSQDSSGGVRHHFVLSPAQRADLIEFLRSIDPTTPIFP